MPSTTFHNPNIILYGPPGTGKTRHTLELAYEILTGNKAPRYEDAQKLFHEELGHRLEFITFHQSFTYEDFVQGFRPKVLNGQMVFKKTNGVFYRIAARARKEWIDAQQGNEINHQLTDNNEATCEDDFEEALSMFSKLIGDSDGFVQVSRRRTSFPVRLDLEKGIVEFRRGETGDYKHLSLKSLRQWFEGRQNVPNPNGTLKYHNYIASYLRQLINTGNKNKANSNNQEIDTNIVTNQVKRLRNYILIIDEINRANIAKVFGELITLLEKDKRLGGTNTLPVRLPSGEEGFTVPANLYLIGTMNTADRSLALLDIALRRRFEFRLLPPRYDVLPNVDNRVALLQKLNQSIIARKSRELQIGHAYFLDPQETLPAIFNNKVIPLLYEYFLNDEKRVQEILQEAGIPSYVDPIAGLRFGEANASA